jgi:hypothetical protein
MKKLLSIFVTTIVFIIYKQVIPIATLFAKEYKNTDKVYVSKNQNFMATHKNPEEFILPEMDEAIYRNAKNNFQILNIKINSRLNLIFDNANEQTIDWLNASLGRGIGKNTKNTKNINISYGKDIAFDKLAIGVAISYNESDLETDYKKIDASCISGTIYSRYNFINMFFLSNILSYSFNKYKEISSFTSINKLLFEMRYSSNQISTSVAVGMDTKYFLTKIGLDYTAIFTNPYKDIYKNTVSKNIYNSLDGTFGITFKNFIGDINNFVIWKSIIIKPQLFVEVGSGIIGPDIIENSKLNIREGYIKPFSRKKIKENFVQYGLDFNVNIEKTLSFDLYYSKINRGGYTDEQLGGGLNFEF